MVNKLVTPPDQDNPVQKKYDDEFEKLTSPEHLAKDGKPGEVDLGSAENRALSDEKKDLYTESTPPPRGRGLRGKWQAAAKWKKYASVAGILAAIVGAFVTIFFALIPLKLQFIITNIQSKVAAVPQYAVERRLEYLTTDYVLRRVGARAAGSNDALYLGNSFTDTLYTNWKAAQYETAIFGDIGLKVEKVGNVGRRGPPSSWRVTSDQFGILSPGGKSTQVFDSKDIRRLIREAAVDKTKPNQVLKRYNMRKVLKRKYGVRSWRVFEKTRESVKGAYLQKKLNLYVRLVESTVGRVSERYSLYLTCLLKGGDSCSDIRKGVKDSPAIDGTGDTDEKKNARKEASDAADRKNSTVSNSLKETLGSGNPDLPNFADDLIEKVQKFTFKKFLGYFTSAVGLLEALSQVDSAIKSGAISTIVADKNAQQYVGYATTFLTINDQITSGEDVDSEDVAAVFEILQDFEESPVYQAEFGGLSNSNVVNAAGSISRDCDGDGVAETLDPGELVCDNKKVVINAESRFTDNSAYQTFSNIIGAYRETLGKVVSVVYNFIGGVVDTVVGDLLTTIMAKLGLDEIAASAFEFVFNWLFGAVVTGAESGGDAYDAIRAGVEINSYELMEDSQYGAGGMLLSSEQVSVLNDELDSEREIQQNNRTFYAKAFSTTEDSLLTRVVLALPSSVDGTIKAIARLPLTILSTVQNIVNFAVTPSSVLAQASGFTNNPFSVLQTGYPLDSTPGYGGELDGFTAIENVVGFDYSAVNKDTIPSFYDLDTPPGIVWDKYGCSVYVSGTPEQIQAHQALFYGKPADMAFEVPVKPNPCMLELSVTQAAAALTGGVLSNGVDNYIPSPTGQGL